VFIGKISDVYFGTKFLFASHREAKRNLVPIKERFIMSYTSRFTSIFSLLFVLFITPAAFALELECGHIKPIQNRFLARHVNYSELNKNLERRTIDQFIKQLDGSKMYLTEVDVNNIKKIMNDVFTKTGKSDCAPIFAAYNILKIRVRESATFVSKHLAEPTFKFVPETKILLDSDKRGYAKDAKVAQEFFKKYVQLQLANYLALEKPIAEAKDKVNKNYTRLVKRVDEEKPWDTLATYLNSFANALDPHTNFWSKAAFQDFEESIRLSLEGIGASLSSRDGLTTIEELIPGGAAARSGLLKAKDIILAVGQGDDGKFEDVVDEELRDVVRKIKGKKGTKVRLNVLRKTGDKSEKLEISLVRDKVKLDDEAAFVEYVEKETDGKKIKVALLNLPAFYADNVTNERSSSGDIRKLLKDIREKKADSIMFDLSTNGGGSLQDAVDIAGQFFREGNVVKQSSKDVIAPEQVLADKDPFVHWTGPLVILVSRATASASEIVSGTLKDYKRAVIVGGDHTYGKGTVQTVEDLHAKLGALKTTIGLYFIPSGQSTQHIGVKSDVVFPSVLDNDDRGEKKLDYSLPAKKIAPFLSAEAFVPANEVGTWQLIDKRTIAALNTKSQARIAKDPEFKKVKDDIKKASEKEKKGEVVVSEFLKDKTDAEKEDKKEEGKDYTQTRASRKEKYLKRADIQEALNIAADLATLQGRGTPLNISSKDVEKKASDQVKQ
jgi:carboxyl-terminal processing protease